MKNKKDSSEMTETKPSDRVATNLSFVHKFDQISFLRLFSGTKNKKQSVNRNIFHTFGIFFIFN